MKTDFMRSSTIKIDADDVRKLLSRGAKAGRNASEQLRHEALKKARTILARKPKTKKGSK